MYLGINGTEFGVRQPDIVVIEWRQDVKFADDGEHLLIDRRASPRVPY
jgi:hypothetical protein